ncbi:MAG: AAA family ATPase [bacterium]
MSTLQAFQSLAGEIETRIIGQQKLINRLLIGLLADGHLLVEGAPGLAKTTAIKELADRLEGDFHRIQFTPDLLPGDLTGTEIYRPETGEFCFQQGPVFHNLVLADEVNRAPAKVQSALLEAMGEHQVTVGKMTYQLPTLFMVMSTQNPIEQEGTYPLPEAQLDRFLLHIEIGYPDTGAEQKILHLARSKARQDAVKKFTAQTMLTQKQVFSAREEVLDLYMEPALETYLVELVLATRNAGKYNADLGRWINYGASPRATIALDRCARAHAWLQGHDYVSPDDIIEVIHDVLRHRILLTYEAEAEGIDTNHVITELVKHVPIA